MRFSPSLLLLVLVTLVTTPFPGCSDKRGLSSGEKLFSLHCASCHPGGSNTTTPSKTLKTVDLQAGMITTPEDIIQKIRNPGPGMPRYTEAMIPEKEARQIARYILETFR